MYLIAGMYFIDPNGGNSLDAIEVYCDIKEQRTCVMSETPEVGQIFIGYHMGDDLISVISRETWFYHKQVSEANE